MKHRIVFSSVVLGAAALLSAEELPFERTEYVSEMQIGKRPRAAEHTQIYSRIQPYQLYGDYTRQWHDRGLFHDNALRKTQNPQLESFRCEMESLKEYDMAGLLVLSNDYPDYYFRLLQLLKDTGTKPGGCLLLPGITAGPNLSLRKNDGRRGGYPLYPVLDAARKSPYSPRIGGKIPLVNYRNFTPETASGLREKLKRDGYSDFAVFVNCWLDVYGHWKTHGKLLPEYREQQKEQLKKMLAHSDGLIHINYHMNRDPRGNYDIDAAFYPELDRRELVPLFEEVYSLPENRGKLLCFDIFHGYINYKSGLTEAEHGTLHLRRAIDTALLYNPDILNLCEWNEANEHTHFQPTMTGSKALQRIIRYYARTLKGLAPIPNEGDDLSIPNLIVSSSKTVRIGEKYQIELLHVPDSAHPAPFTVEVSLYDESGKLRKTFQKETFTGEKMRSVTYTVPTEQLPNVRALAPVVKTVNAAGKELVFRHLNNTRIDRSIQLERKEILQPLRDLFEPLKADFQVRKQADGSYEIAADVVSDRPLRAAEVFDNGMLVSAFDAHPEFDRAKYDVLRITFTTFPRKTGKASFRLAGMEDFSYYLPVAPYYGFLPYAVKKGDTLVFRTFTLNYDNPTLFLLIPKKRGTDMVLQADFGKFGSGSWKPEELLKAGSTAAELPGCISVIFRKMEGHEVMDHPLSIGDKKCCFRIRTGSQFPVPAFHLRLQSEDGKLYRSPLLFPAKPSQETALTVFSATTGKPVTLPAQETAENEYVFNPEHGNILCSRSFPFMDALLGGGFQYFHMMWSSGPPAGTVHSAPEWVREPDGSHSLEFDGKGNYISLPPEAVPTGAFTMEFDCRTESEGDQMLFLHGNHRQGSLMLSIRSGRLFATFESMGVNYAGRKTEFPTSLQIPKGKRLRITVIYDYRNLIFGVDGQWQAFPFSERAQQPTAAVFGGYNTKRYPGYGNCGFFQGKLYSLKFKYYATPYQITTERNNMKSLAQTLGMLLIPAAAFCGTELDINGTFAGASADAETAPGWVKNHVKNPNIGIGSIRQGKDGAATLTVASKNIPTHFFSRKIHRAKAGDAVRISGTVSGKGKFCFAIYLRDAKNNYIAMQQGTLRDVPAAKETVVESLKIENMKGKDTAFIQIVLVAWRFSEVSFENVKAELIPAAQ